MPTAAVRVGRASTFSGGPHQYWVYCQVTIGRSILGDLSLATNPDFHHPAFYIECDAYRIAAVRHSVKTSIFC